MTGHRLAVHGVHQATRLGASFHLMRSAVGLRADDTLRVTVSSGIEVASRSALLSPRRLDDQVRFAMPPEAGTWVGRHVVVGTWVSGGFGSPSFGRPATVAPEVTSA